MTGNSLEKRMMFAIYLASTFYSLGYALPLYVSSTFLKNFVATEHAVGIIFTLGAFFSMVSVYILPRLLKRFGNYRTTLSVTILEILALGIIAVAINPWIVISAFIMSQVFINILYLNLSAFLEAYSHTETKGSTRALFLTLINTAILLAPLFAGFLLAKATFAGIYLASALAMVFVFLITHQTLRDFKDPAYKLFSFFNTLQHIAHNHNIHAILVVQFILNFFYSWMVIYTPIYLVEIIKIPLSDYLSIIMPITLLPFVFFQRPLGKLADRLFGEKEILFVSVSIMAIATSMLSFITSSSLIVWTLALVATRIGASGMEIMAESYFYKQVTARDVQLMTFLHMTRMSAYLVGPLAGAVVLYVIDYHFIFLALGMMTLLALPFVLHFKDSR